MIDLVRAFFAEEKRKMLNAFYKASMLGNTKLAIQKQKDLLKYLFYEDYLLSNINILSEKIVKEIISCFENCDINLKKLRLVLQDLRGVNIDIIENEDEKEKTLIAY